MTPVDLIVAFGLPGAMSDWGFATLHAVVRERCPDAVVLHADSLEVVHSRRTDSPSVPVVLTSQFPEPALMGWVLASGARPLLFWEETVGAVAHVARAAPPTDPLQTDIAPVRIISASAACLSPLQGQGAVQRLDRRIAGSVGTDGLATEMCRHIGIEAPAPGLADRQPHVGTTPGDVAIAALADPQAATDTVTREGWNASPQHTPIPDHLLRLVADALSPFDRLFQDGTLPPIVWPGSAFLLGDRPGEPLPETIDMTGGARCLVYGPYLHLPAGRWTARLELGVGGHIGRQGFAVELLGPDLLKRIRFPAPARGSHAASFDFYLTLPQSPVEIRLMMERGAIEGTISLLSLKMTREASPFPNSGTAISS